MPILTPQQIYEECKKKAGKGLEAGARFYNNRLKEVLSVPAPRALIKAGKQYKVNFTTRKGKSVSFTATASQNFYRATTPATKGAPPRKLSGRLRAAQQVDFNETANVARVGSNVEYARDLELGKTKGAPMHKFLLPTLVTNLGGIAVVIGTQFSSSGSTLGGQG